MYAFGAMLSFTIAHLAVIRLRSKDPDRERPYRGPGKIRVRGRELPLFAVLGAMGTGLAFVTVTVLYPAVAAAGIGWLIIGVLVYVFYRRRQHLDLVTTVKVAIPRPVVDTEAEYDSVMVVFDEAGFEPEILATARRLAARRRRGIHVLVPITVPWNSPIDAELGDLELKAQNLIEEAKVGGGRRVTGHWEKVRPGQAGRRIVDEAKEMRARAIVMPLGRRSGTGPLFSKNLETVLHERPCRVIIESVPGRDGASGNGG
jgi:APA family basic amino acid/polyamine antiporter